MTAANVLYVSPSTLPSRAANAVHVVQQCEGFSQNGATVELLARRNSGSAAALHAEIVKSYDVAFTRVRLNTITFPSSRGAIMALAAMGIRRAVALRGSRPLILSRNLYASYALARAGIPHLYETHQLGLGRLKGLEHFILTREFIRPIVISTMLKTILEEHHLVRLDKALILHDAAPAGITRLSGDKRPAARTSLLAQAGLPPADFVAGYFGHLYAGRGLEIIESMAAAHGDVPFLVFGGNEADLAAHRARPHPANLHFLGYVPHVQAQAAMQACDVLLMPYQRSVSIGVEGQDTARWMSPMKMFEYMASGNAILSSDLPVLAEVLEDGRNALLIAPEDTAAWITALARMRLRPELRETIGAAAHDDYRRHYTWERRAAAILEAAQQ